MTIEVKPRRGRVIDLDYLAWLHTQPGVVNGGKCYSVHHVRSFGSPKNDRRAIPLEFGYHTEQEGAQSIERMDKQKWQEWTGVDIEKEISRLNKLYEETR
jgi:hypothetical protein